MTAEALELKLILNRLETLERQNRRLRRVVALMLAGVASILLLGQSSRHTRTLEAEKFIIKDTDGKKRAELGAFKDFPALVLYDKTESVVASLGGGDSGPGLFLSGGVNQGTAVLRTEVSGPNLSLYDGAKKLRAKLALIRGQGPGLLLADENEKAKALLGENSDGLVLAPFR